MTPRCVFIGDEVTASGFSLAGVEALVVLEDEARRLFAGAMRSADLVLITAEAARGLDQSVLSAALREQRPPVLVIADIRGRLQPEDLSLVLRRQLGLAE